MFGFSSISECPFATLPIEIYTVSMGEVANAQDVQSATNHVILRVIENGNAVDVYNVTPIFRASDNVWHVSPRLDYQHVMTRLDYWTVPTRLDYWRIYE